MSLAAADYPAGLVTLVFTDIENSSELSERFGAAFEMPRAAHFALLDEAAARWRGIPISTAGDSLFLVFADPPDAVRWAVDAQRALAQHDWHNMDVRVRIGMHTGEPFPSTEGGGRVNYYGPPVNRAARVMAAGHGGQILVSDATRAACPPDFFGETAAPVTFRDCGVHRLKGVGEERLWQVCHPDLPADFPPLSTLSPERHNLPAPATPFVGRENEIAAWQNVLRRPATRLLTLSGFGGMGKTRTALQLAEQCVEDFAHGAWWVELEEAQTGEEMIGRIAAQLRLPPRPELPVRDHLHQFLRERQLLLILDNVEQVAGAADVIRDLLSDAPGVKCLVTSRRALLLRAETVVEVPPLPGGEAEKLFVERARSSQADFALTSENAADVAELCRRLEGVPLAIELAAARAVGMTPRQMVGRLNERFRLLQTRAPDLPPRQRALRGAIDWSYNLLGDDERALFAQLGVFVGGFTMEDAEAVCESFDVFEDVMELRRHSLFRTMTDPQTQQAQFLLLESLREYALERLLESSDGGTAVRRKHADHYRRFARTRLQTLRTPQEGAALRQLEDQSGNLRAALAWAKTVGEHALCAEIALLLGVLLQRQGFRREAVGLVEMGMGEIAPQLTNAHPALYAQLLRERAGLHLDHLEAAHARELAQQALALFAGLGDPQGQAQTENLLGQAAMEASDFDQARAHFSLALAHFERVGNIAETAIVHNNLGIVERRDAANGSKTEAARHLNEALRLHRTLDDQRGMAESLNNLGVLAHGQGDLDEAWRCYVEALSGERALRHPFGEARALSNLGEVAEAQNRLEQACRLFAVSERLFEEVKSAYAIYTADLLAAAAAKQNASLESLRRTARTLPPDALADWAMSAAGTVPQPGTL